MILSKATIHNATHDRATFRKTFSRMTLKILTLSKAIDTQQSNNWQSSIQQNDTWLNDIRQSNAQQNDILQNNIRRMTLGIIILQSNACKVTTDKGKFSRMTLGRMTYDKAMLVKMTFAKATCSRITFGKMIFSKAMLNKMTIDKATLSRMGIDKIILQSYAQQNDNWQK